MYSYLYLIGERLELARLLPELVVPEVHVGPEAGELLLGAAQLLLQLLHLLLQLVVRLQGRRVGRRRRRRLVGAAMT